MLRVHDKACDPSMARSGGVLCELLLLLLTSTPSFQLAVFVTA